jgi:hypothetical protein
LERFLDGMDVLLSFTKINRSIMTNNKQQTAMKKLLLATLLIGMISGCTEPTVSSRTTNYTIPSKGKLASDPLKVCVIEECEYFICENYKGNILCHKGNCKNIIHWR